MYPVGIIIQFLVCTNPNHELVESDHATISQRTGLEDHMTKSSALQKLLHHHKTSNFKYGHQSHQRRAQEALNIVRPQRH